MHNYTFGGKGVKSLMKKKSKNLPKRIRVRSPIIAGAFCRRFRQAIKETGTTQSHLAGKFGGFSKQMINRLVNGEAKTLPIDFTVRLVEWADTAGISLRWLFLGLGAMHIAESSELAESADSLNQMVTNRLILALAERAGVDLDDIVDDSLIANYVPGRGFFTRPLRDSLEQKKTKKKKAKPPAG